MADSLVSRMRNRTGSSNPYMYVILVSENFAESCSDLLPLISTVLTMFSYTGLCILGLRKGWWAYHSVILWGQGKRRLKWLNIEKKNGLDAIR